MNQIIAFDQRLRVRWPLRLRVEACHRHSLVLSINECPPELSGWQHRLVVWLHPARGLVPFGLCCDSPESFESLPKTIGATARCHGAQFDFENGARFELKGSGCDLRISPAACRLSDELMRSRQEFIKRQIDNDSPHSELLASVLQKRLDILISRILVGDFGINGELIRPLIGLGQGSTPSGDDMIAGVLAALWTMNTPEAIAARAAIAREIYWLAPNQTTRTSCDMLWHAANGYFPEALGNVASALSDRDCDSEEFKFRVETLGQLGATSGRDMVMGFFMLALKFIF